MPPSQSPLEQAGAQPQKQPKAKPIHIARLESGLFTQRNPLHDISDFATYRFYGGFPDALWDGSNMEITNKLTIGRRPGNSLWSTATYPSSPISFFSWEDLNGVFRVMVDTATAVYQDNQNGTKALIYTKSAGAGAAYFVSVGNILYIGDGVDQLKYTPNDTNGIVWNWGIAAPTSQPTVTTVESGAATVPWTASTWYSTIGVVIDSNGVAELLINVNNNGSTIGLSSSGQPAWNQTLTGFTTDNTISWENAGQVHPWTPHSGWAGTGNIGQFGYPHLCYDQVTGNFFFSTTTGTTGATRPNFQAIVGAGTNNDGTVNWFCIGGVNNGGIYANEWQPSKVWSGGNLIIEPFLPPAAPGIPLSSQPIYAQVTAGGGTSGSYSSPFGSSALAAGVQTVDNQLLWISLGSATWASGTTYNAWTSSTNYGFNVLKDSNGNLQVCTVGGVSAGTQPTWGTTYGTSVIESTGVTWVCVGSATYATWTASQNYYRPVNGFQAPTGSDPYGGAAVNDGTNAEFCIATGLSGVAPPSWNPTVGGTTTDNHVTWYNNGVPNSHSLSWTKGHVYAYSYKARALTDYYSTLVNGILPIPPGLTTALPAPTGSETGEISTASPVFTLSGSNPGAVNTVSGVGSTDPQVDTIVIWRDADGGGPDNMFELTEVPAPAPVGGIAQPWSFQDWLPDTPTSTYPGLNTLIPAPIDDTNDPPPVGFLPMAYHFERIWGAVGQFIYCSGGGDVITGNPNESFNPSENFEFESPCIRLLPTATGIYNFTTSDVFAILGGPSFTAFYPSPGIPGVGLLHYWALDQHGAVIYLFTADKQFVSIDPSAGVNRIGAGLGDKFATWNPANVFVTVYESGVDNCVMVSDGATGWYRLNPSQFPNGRPVWSPFATIVGGVSAVQSIQTSAGVHQLLIGSPATGSPPAASILKRDLTTYADGGNATGSPPTAGTPYTCFFNMGAIKLCFPGQIAGVTFLAIKAANTGTAPTVEYLPEELSGSFTTLANPQPYPWQLYGKTGSPASYLSNAYYLNQNQDAALMTFLFVECSWPAENYNAEVYELTVFGTLLTDE